MMLFVPNWALAEVMDKEAPLSRIWGTACVTAVLLFVGLRFGFWKTTLAISMIPPLLFLVVISEVTDPYVGPAILKEAGIQYVLSAWWAPLLSARCGVLGWYLHQRAKACPRNLNDI